MLRGFGCTAVGLMLCFGLLVAAEEKKAQKSEEPGHPCRVEGKIVAICGSELTVVDAQGQKHCVLCCDKECKVTAPDGRKHKCSDLKIGELVKMKGVEVKCCKCTEIVIEK